MSYKSVLYTFYIILAGNGATSDRFEPGTKNKTKNKKVCILNFLLGSNLS